LVIAKTIIVIKSNYQKYYWPCSSSSFDKPRGIHAGFFVNIC
jgi:hypothetical protein